MCLKSAVLIALSTALVTRSLRAGDSAVAPTPDLVANAAYTDVADTTMNAPGESTKFSGFYSPQSSGSNIAFLGLFNSNNGNGIYTGVAGTTGTSRVADTTMTAPGQTTAFTYFGNPSLSGSNVAFEAESSNSNVDGIYTGVAGTTGTSRVADTSMTAPGQATTFYTFYPPAISGGNVADLAQYDLGNGQGIYTGVAGTTGVARLADTSTIAPGQAAAFSSFNSPVISGGNVAFIATYSGGSGVYTGVAGTTSATRLADTSTTAPGQATAFSSFGYVAVSGSNVGFSANYNGGNGIYTAMMGTTGLTRIADTSMTAPGQTSLFTNIYSPSLSGSNLAFVANYGNGQGIYAGVAGTTGVTRIADTSMTVPGQSTAFDEFSDLAISGSDIAFFAFYNQGNGEGIFLDHGGSLLDVAESGEPLFGSTIAYFIAGETGLDGNNLSFGYVLTDGVAGEATFMINEVPEPSTWAAVLGGSGIVALAWRRRAARS